MEGFTVAGGLLPLGQFLDTLGDVDIQYGYGDSSSPAVIRLPPYPFQDSLAAFNQQGGTELRFSTGWAITERPETWEACVKEADELLYRQKRGQGSA